MFILLGSEMGESRLSVGGQCHRQVSVERAKFLKTNTQGLEEASHRLQSYIMIWIPAHPDEVSQWLHQELVSEDGPQDAYPWPSHRNNKQRAARGTANGRQLNKIVKLKLIKKLRDIPHPQSTLSYMKDRLESTDRSRPIRSHF